MPATVPRAREPQVALALSLCDRLLAEHLSALEARFGAPALGLMDLPPLTGGYIEPDQLRVVPTLYWTREVDAAGVLDTVDALAHGVVDGTVVEPMGEVVNELALWWRHREERFNALERRALFSHLFGGEGHAEPNADFPELMRRFAEVLSELGRTPRNEGLVHLQAQVAAAGQALAANLSERSAGVAAFAARDIVAQIRAALRILGDGGLVQAFGGGGPFRLIERLAPRLLGKPFSPTPHLSRAEAGLRLLTWLARSAGGLNEEGVRVSRDDEVVHAANTWLAAAGAED